MMSWRWGGCVLVILSGCQEDAAVEGAAAVQSIESVTDPEPVVRPTLSGAMRDGLAWEDYNRALEHGWALLQRPGESEQLTKLERGALEALDPVGLESLRERWALAVTSMREGAHRSDATPPVIVDPGEVDSAASPVRLGRTSRQVVVMAGLDAEDALQAGRPGEAVRLTLDAATFGWDITRSTLLIQQVIGMAVLDLATAKFWTDSRLRRLDPESLALLATGLERLDQQLPTSVRLRDEVELFSRTHWTADSGDAETDRALTELADKMRSTVDRLEAAESSRWPERRRTFGAFGETLAVVFSAEQSRRSVIAELRMLRMAISLRRDRQPSSLEDPLGDGELTLERAESGWRIVCSGTPQREGLLREVAPPAPR